MISLRLAADFDHMRRDLDSSGRKAALDAFHTCVRSFVVLDQSLSTLIEDLHERGLDKNVVVVMWGEFGRSPRPLAAGHERRHCRGRIEDRPGHRLD